MRATFIASLLVCLTVAGFAQTPKCRVCEKPIEGKFFHLEDKVRGGKVEICTDCGALESRCFACGLPVKPGATKLTDGRFLCARDAEHAILDDDEAKKICVATREELDRLFSRFLFFPSTNVVLTIVDRFTLESLFKSPGHGQRCTSIFGATRSHELGARRYFHSISVLSGLSKSRLGAVGAHEFSHTWLTENVRPERKAALSPDALEAFCEFIAYELVDLRKDDYEKKSIKENPYTRGQLDAFLAAERRHGFNAILEWIKSGESPKLDADDPDGVRSVSAPATEAAAPPVRFTSPAPAPIPDTLTLKGISGTAARRYAIINDRTFGVMDSARMKLAKTNLLVRCLEIRTNSVLLQIEGRSEKQELFLSEE